MTVLSLGKPPKRVGDTIYLDNSSFFCRMRKYQYSLLSAIEREVTEVWTNNFQTLFIIITEMQFTEVIVRRCQRRRKQVPEPVEFCILVN